MRPLHRKRALRPICRLRWYFNPFFKVHYNSGNSFKIKVIAETYRRRKLHSLRFSVCNLELCPLKKPATFMNWKNFVILTLNLSLGASQRLIPAIIFSNKINIYFSVSRVEVHFRSQTSFWEMIAIIPIPLCFVSLSTGWNNLCEPPIYYPQI